MEPVFGLVGAILGAAIVLGGQVIAHRLQRRDESVRLLMDNCAQLVALQEAFRGMVWDERNLKVKGLVATWNSQEYRLAEARSRFLAGTTGVVEPLLELREASKALAIAWKVGPEETAAVDAAYRQHRLALDAFIAACAEAFSSEVP